jgi:ATP-dependent DNA ligase
MKTYFPPKPTLITITQPLFAQLELRDDVVCEKKYNGNRLILKRYEVPGPIAHYEFWNRDGTLMKYTPSQELLDSLDTIRWAGDCVLDGELLHFKKKQTKNWVVIFDIYLWAGLPMTDHPFKMRRKLLEEIFTDTKEIIDESYLELSPQWKGGVKGCFKQVYDEVTQKDEIEGLVIKSLGSKVTLGSKSSPVVATMWKVRKPVVSGRTGNTYLRF